MKIILYLLEKIWLTSKSYKEKEIKRLIGELGDSEDMVQVQKADINILRDWIMRLENSNRNLKSAIYDIQI